MKSHFPVTARWCGALTVVAAIIQPAAADVFDFHADHVLGASLDIKIEARSHAGADLAWRKARAEISRLEQLFSTWKDNSEVSQLNDRRRLRVSPETARLLERCQFWWEETAGALDCRLGRVIGAWSDAVETGGADGAVIEGLLSQAHASEIRINGLNADVSGEATLRVDAFAKGVIIDAALAMAFEASPDVQGVLINIGGDIRAKGEFADGGVRVGVAGPGDADNDAPAETLLLNNAAIATSGAGQRDLIISGQRHSHIISPFTGRPQESVATVTVVASTAEAADALASAFAVSGVATSLGYANSHDGVETMIITRGGSRFASDGWKGLRAPVETVTAEAAGVTNPWPDRWRLEVAYEIPKVDAGDYEYPYVVAWVTDAENKPVRHLLMLGDSPRWLEENYVHWRRVGRKSPAIVDHVARPTRPPGRYDLVWDGRDDHGRPVAQGDYVLHVEASREHGGHQYEKIPLSLTDAPVSGVSEAGDEIGSVSVAYGEAGRGA